jgi:hypothetical protein
MLRLDERLAVVRIAEGPPGLGPEVVDLEEAQGGQGRDQEDQADRRGDRRQSHLDRAARDSGEPAFGQGQAEPAGPGFELAVDLLDLARVLGGLLGHRPAAPHEGPHEEGEGEEQREQGEGEARPAREAFREPLLERPGERDQEDREGERHGDHLGPLEEREHQDGRGHGQEAHPRPPGPGLRRASLLADAPLHAGAGVQRACL